MLLVAVENTCCLAWKCSERAYNVLGTRSNWVRLLNQGRKTEASRAVVAVVADDGPQGGLFADLTEELLLQQLAKVL